MTFPQALNHLIKTYRIDTSKLPDAPEAEVMKIRSREVTKIDPRRFSLEKMSQAIQTVRDEIADDTYAKFVYTYMMLKYVVPDEKFKEMYDKFRGAVLKVFEKQKL